MSRHRLSISGTWPARNVYRVPTNESRCIFRIHDAAPRTLTKLIVTASKVQDVCRFLAGKIDSAWDAEGEGGRGSIAGSNVTTPPLRPIAAPIEFFRQ